MLGEFRSRDHDGGSRGVALIHEGAGLGHHSQGANDIGTETDVALGVHAERQLILSSDVQVELDLAHLIFGKLICHDLRGGGLVDTSLLGAFGIHNGGVIGFDDLEDRRPLLDGFLLDDNPLDIRIFVGGIGLGQVDSRHPGLELGGAHCGRRAEIDRLSCVLTFGLLGLLALHAFDGQLILCALLHLMRIGGLGGGSGLCSGDGLFEDALLLGKILVGRLIGRELLAHLVRGDGVHDAEHGRDGGLVAHGARGVGQEEAIGDDGNAVRKRNQGRHDGEHP